MSADSGAKFEELAKAFSITQLPESEVELTGEVPWTTIEPYRNKALGEIAQEIEMPGFRKGNVPHDLALKKVGEVAVLEEAVELFVKDFYPELIVTREIDAVGRPDIRITKLAPNNPVALTIRASVYPEVTLPNNYKDIHAGIALEAAADATDEEVNQTIESLRQSRATPNPLVGEDGKPLPPTLPEVTDEWVKTLGAFDSVEALKAQIKKGIGEEKVRAAKDARRGKIIEALLEKVTVAVPRVFVESELDKIMSQMREDIERMGLQFEDYLKHASKTEEGVRNEFREQAAKRAKLQLTLNKIALDEKIEPAKEASDNEMKHALEHFPDANPELLRVHIESVLRNELVLKLLEGEK